MMQGGGMMSSDVEQLLQYLANLQGMGQEGTSVPNPGEILARPAANPVSRVRGMASAGMGGPQAPQMAEMMGPQQAQPQGMGSAPPPAAQPMPQMNPVMQEMMLKFMEEAEGIGLDGELRDQYAMMKFNQYLDETGQ